MEDPFFKYFPHVFLGMVAIVLLWGIWGFIATERWNRQQDRQYQRTQDLIHEYWARKRRDGWEAAQDWLDTQENVPITLRVLG
jgi:hypothetical protein